MVRVENNPLRIPETRLVDAESPLAIGEILPAVLERYGLTDRISRRSLPNDRKSRGGTVQHPLLTALPTGSLRVGSWQPT